MSEQAKKVLIAVIAVGIAVAFLVVLSSGNSDNASDTDAGKVPTVVVGKDGKPEGGVADLTYNKGDRIHFKVKVPFQEEVHLHGYDVAKEVPKGGGTVTYDLPASIEGVFEAELEDRKEQIVELTVNP